MARGPLRGLRVAELYAVAVGRFYEELAEKLVAGARASFEEAGAQVEIHDVPDRRPPSRRFGETRGHSRVWHPGRQRHGMTASPSVR